MAEIQCVKIRIRPGKTEQVLTFISNLKSRMEEAQEAVAREGVILETLFLERTPGADYIIFYMRAESLAAATQVAATSTHPLDVATRQMITEAWGEAVLLEQLFDIERK